MYEAKQNKEKEKVSRRIDGAGGGVRQRVKMGKVNMHMTAQFTSDAKKNTKDCIQLLKMKEHALKVDFIDPKRRNNYFSSKTLDFFNKHNYSRNILNESKTYDVQNGKLCLDDHKEDIEFLPHPLRDMMPKKGINTVAQNEKLKWRIDDSIYGGGYLSNTYTRKSGTDSFEESLEQQLLKYKEVMFITKGSTMYFAPNGKENIQLSHPSLLGGYQYEVDDAGTLGIQDDRIVAMEDSGHYGKGGGQINTEITNMLTPQ